jgi:murein DD-endopeptidase MepM/ murein hydrolase activator NlpD
MAILRAGAIAALAAAAIFLAACSAGDSPDDGAGDVFIRSLPTSTALPTPEPTSTAAPEPTATAMPEPTATALLPTPTLPPPPTAAPTNEEQPASTPAAPTGDGQNVELSPASVPQGGVFVVRLRNAPPEPTPVVFFSGVSHAMLLQAQLWWAVIGVAANFPPGQERVQISTDAGADGVPILTITVTDAAFPEENIDLPPETSGLLTDAPAIEQEKQLLESLYAGLTPERLWSGTFSMPATGALGDGFGFKRSFNGGPYSNHTGLDILAAEGAPVTAANTGRVVYTGALQLRGNTIVIDHGAGVFTGYHHLSQISVAQGQTVAQGETIGAVGATGLVTAAHLHWELIVRGVRVDPLPWTQAEIAP